MFLLPLDKHGEVEMLGHVVVLLSKGVLDASDRNVFQVLRGTNHW